MNQPRTLPDILDDTISSMFAPQPIIRLETIRIFASLAIVGFVLTHGAFHADDWLSSEGFRPPHYAHDWRNPLDLAPLSSTTAWLVAIAIVVSGLATAAGAATRLSAGVFAFLLAYVALADRANTYTVNKISPFIALALCLTPSGTKWSVDGWLKKRRDPNYQPPELVSGGCVRYFQFFLPVFYCSSGVWKATGDWLSYPYVLWTHLHDSYQTPISWFLANHTPPFVFTILQGITLLFELFAPIWFFFRVTRPYALVWGIGMHFMIGVMFGPVIWFSLLMITLLVGSYAPERYLRKILRQAPALPDRAATRSVAESK